MTFQFNYIYTLIKFSINIFDFPDLKNALFNIILFIKIYYHS